MSAKNQYETLYQQDTAVCGPPFPEILAFFDTWPVQNGRILDLGCGQGRDALPIARRGHAVVGVDIAPTGIAQMVAAATAEALPITGIVADVATYQPDGRFDAVLLDRVLHMLPEPAARTAVLDTIRPHVRPGGVLLIADTHKNIRAFRTHLAGWPDWQVLQAQKGFLFAKLVD